MNSTASFFGLSRPVQMLLHRSQAADVLPPAGDATKNLDARVPDVQRPQSDYRPANLSLAMTRSVVSPRILTLMVSRSSKPRLVAALP